MKVEKLEIMIKMIWRLISHLEKEYIQLLIKKRKKLLNSPQKMIIKIKIIIAPGGRN